MRHVTKLLLYYSRFLVRAKGDMEAAALVYRKAAEVRTCGLACIRQLS